MSVELKLSRNSRVYRPSEPLEGKIIIKSQSSISHHGVRITVNGSVNLQVHGGSAGIIESFYGVVKPIPIVKKTVDVKSSGKIGSGTTEIPFSLILRQQGDESLERRYETFHGADISIQYLVTVDIIRGYMHKSLSATMEFIVETDRADLPERPISPEMVIFYITQDTQRHPLLPELKSGGFRLLRVESVLLEEKIVTETSLIQTTQIADGDVCRNFTLPIHVVLPRLLTCPTILAGPFSIEFKVSIVISFQSELSKLHLKTDPRTPRLWLAMETLPLELVRTR
ncbi:Down syndrome critical region protein 3 like [Quillaja saponaria]|uniref:Vacuolar protein sorting-associated protein 26C n=1 Tax=Quillaja saponaria TaxID=32244 RepID=A0AAD7Q5J9_QUISA|nr:Down syndrome critical region protein 3 like [Quillaja saponaria]